MDEVGAPEFEVTANAVGVRAEVAGVGFPFSGRQGHGGAGWAAGGRQIPDRGRVGGNGYVSGAAFSISRGGRVGCELP